MVSAIKYSKWSEDIKAAILDEIRTTLQMLQDMSAQLLRKAMEGVAGTMKLLLRTTVAMVIAYYFVKDAEKLKNRSLQWPRERGEKAWRKQERR